ncbi:MAG: LacI family DNA-binding transcriptional regulator [Mycetocola sp.]
MTVSVRDVAAAAGVSVGTVSNVLNRPERVSAATVERVQEVIQELGFVRNDAARQLRAGRSRSIGLVVLDVRNPFFTDLARGAEDRAVDAGLSVLLGSSENSTDRERAYLDLFEQQRVEGILISPMHEDLPDLTRIFERGTPIVLVDRVTSDTRIPSVAVDDVAGGRIAAEHLISLGRTRIACVTGPQHIRQVADRLQGAREAVAAHPGVSLEVITRPALTVLEGRTAGEEIRERAEADRPDAVFAANDLLAIGLLQAFTILGHISVPGDIALIGYDDIDFATSTVVPLSSIRQPSALIGATAFDMLQQQRDGGTDVESVLYQPTLVVRQSTAG